jgi:hypothetical protein
MLRERYIAASLVVAVIAMLGIIYNDVFYDECEYRYPAERIRVGEIENYVDKANYKIVLMRSKYNRCYEFVVVDRNKRYFDMKLDQKTGELVRLYEISDYPNQN